MEQDVRAEFDRMDRRFEGLERLIFDFKESLERELGNLRHDMQQGFAQVTTRFDTRFDTQALRLDRHAALWQTGRRWSSKMDIWAERFDQALETKDREIAELRERLTKLEKKSA